MRVNNPEIRPFFIYLRVSFYHFKLCWKQFINITKLTICLYLKITFCSSISSEYGSLKIRNCHIFLRSKFQKKKIIGDNLIANGMILSGLLEKSMWPVTEFPKITSNTLVPIPKAHQRFGNLCLKLNITTDCRYV